MRPALLIDEYLRLRSARSSPPSPTGLQLERLRLNLPANANLHAAELQLDHFARLVLALSTLSELELTVIFAARTPVGTKAYEREVRDGDLVVEERDMPDGSKERWQGTRRDERFKAPGHAPGFVVVEGSRAVFPTRKQIAASLGLTEGEVKYRISAAYTKLEAMGDEA